jgi:ribokinase
MAPLNIKKGLQYGCLIGTGGIGSGLFFAMNENHTLGREESRSGRYLDYHDYCKLHIITHYVKTLLGPGFEVIPLGKVGDDDVGRRLIVEMENTGFDLRYIRVSLSARTLFSICFIYPDGSGGNLTPVESACTEVDESHITQVEPDFMRFAGRGIALAAPEVPLAARQALLQLGTRYHFLRAASFVSAEIAQAKEMDLFCLVDLVALNIHEAAAVAGMEAENDEPLAIVEATIQTLMNANPTIRLSITAGRKGNWSWDGKNLVHMPAFQVETINTAGAGDAHLAGILVGLTAGLPLCQAQELGTLLAALSVTSQHTINPEIERRSLNAFTNKIGYSLAQPVLELLEE